MEYDWMHKHPVIRFVDVVRRFNSREYARLFIHRKVKEGKIKRVMRGIYTASEDMFSIASNIYIPSYISFLSASYYYGLTETIPLKISIATPKSYNQIWFNGYELEFIHMRYMWGFHKENNQAFIADLEKLAIDAFLKPNKMGNFIEIENVFNSNIKLDIRKLKGYLKKINSNKLFRRVGYMLEKYRDIDISNIMNIDNNYYTLNPFKHKKKNLDKKWRLFI